MSSNCSSTLCVAFLLITAMLVAEVTLKIATIPWVAAAVLGTDPWAPGQGLACAYWPAGKGCPLPARSLLIPKGARKSGRRPAHGPARVKQVEVARADKGAGKKGHESGQQGKSRTTE